MINWRLLETFTPGARVLDIGCGAGAWEPELRRRGGVTLVGVEISAEAAAAAEARYDRVVRSPSEVLDVDQLGGSFDTIIAADVIEHLVDPFTELDRWRAWCSPAGELVISTPNIRHFRVVRELVLRGRFDYVDGGGVMDRTHLRWFTQASLADALVGAGWRPQRWGNLRTGKSGSLNQLSGYRLNGFLAPQLQVVAKLQDRS